MDPSWEGPMIHQNSSQGEGESHGFFVGSPCSPFPDAPNVSLGMRLLTKRQMMIVVYNHRNETQGI